MSWKSTLATCVPSWRRRANHGSSALFAVWDTSSRNKTWYRECKSDVSKRIRRDIHTPKATVFERGRPRSLRLRLLLWYGSLIAVALGFFAMLFLILTTNAIEQSVTSTVHTEARIAMLDTLDNLFPAPPYWQDPLSMQVVDTYRDPGVVVEVLDAQGQVRYLSTSGTRIPLSNDTTRTVLAGQPPVSYDASVDGQHVRNRRLTSKHRARRIVAQWNTRATGREIAHLTLCIQHLDHHARITVRVDNLHGKWILPVGLSREQIIKRIQHGDSRLCIYRARDALFHGLGRQDQEEHGKES